MENLLEAWKEFKKGKKSKKDVQLKLILHPDKVYIKTLASGVDFLGWVNFLDHRVLRTITKRRMFKRMQVNSNENVIQSYLGLLGHGNTKKLLLNVL